MLYSPGPTEPNPDFKLVVNLEELLAGFHYDLEDPRFSSIASQFEGDTVGYIARGLIHGCMGIPGGLTTGEAVRFFPYELEGTARQFIENFWMALSKDVSRLETMIRHNYPGRSFEANRVPSPMVTGGYCLTIWYHWRTPQQIAADNYMELEETEEPASRGF
jgi:hypothetical protein